MSPRPSPRMRRCGSPLPARISTTPDVETSTDVTVPLGSAGAGAARLEKVGLLLLMEDGKAKLEEPLPGSPFESLGRTFDFYADVPVEVASVALPRDRMPKEVFYLPALLAIVVVIFIQRRRVAAALT